MDVPLTCGLLNETEARITSDYDATALLEELKAGVWSVEQVTVAFCKRAAIAHQLVRSFSFHQIEFANPKPVADELSDGDLLKRCYRTSEET